MRLLFVARRYPPAEGHAGLGPEWAFARLFEEARRRAEPLLIAGWAARRSDLPAGALGVDVRGGGLLAHLQLVRAIASARARFRPAVVIAASADVPAAGGRSVLALRDLDGTGWEEGTGLADRLAGARLPRWGRVVVPGGAARDALLARGASRWRVHRIPEGWGEWPEPTPLPGGERLAVVVAGPVHPARGVHLAVEAVARLAPEEKARVQLTVAGPAEDRRYLDQLRVAARGQPVAFLPGAPIGPAISASDLVLYPICASEGAADGVVAAMARGRCVVWSDLPGVRETAGESGVPVVPGDVLALRARIREALAGDLALARLGAEARALARARYDWSVVWPRWRALLDDVAR